MSGLETRCIFLLFTFLSPANECINYCFNTLLTWLQRKVTREEVSEMVHFFNILIVAEHKHILQTFLRWFQFTLEVTTPPWPIHPPPPWLGETLQYDTTWLNLCWERCTGVYFGAHPPPFVENEHKIMCSFWVLMNAPNCVFSFQECWMKP